MRLATVVLHVDGGAVSDVLAFHARAFGLERRHHDADSRSGGPSAGRTVIAIVARATCARRRPGAVRRTPPAPTPAPTPAGDPAP